MKAEAEESGETSDYKPNDKTQQRIQILVYVLYALGIGFFIGLCCLWKNLAIAIAVLKTSAVIIMHNIRMFFMPFFSAFVIMLWTTFWIVFFILLLSTGKIT